MLIDTGAVGDDSWRLSWRTPLTLLGPGSVPLAVLILAIGQQVLRTMYGAGTGAAWLLALAPAVAVVLARFLPLVAWLLIVSGFAAVAWGWPVAEAAPWPWTVPELLALLIVQFAVATRRGWPAIACWVAHVALTGWPVQSAPDTGLIRANLVLVAILSGLALVAGLIVRLVRHLRQRVVEEERLTAEERARRQLLEERARIARELHDIVAHHMSVITVQASTAEYRLDDVGPSARLEFRSISTQARESLTELRRLLSVLRNDDAASTVPHPGIDDLESLVESARRSGTPVELSLDGISDRLPETVSLTAYRIVQEALSNVVRHASGAQTVVRLDGIDELIVSVENAPPRGVDPDLGGAGLGIAGMRERVGVLGGTLTAEPTAAGGFGVRAVLPTTRETLAQ